MLVYLDMIMNNPITNTILAIVGIVSLYITHKCAQVNRLQFVISDNELINNRQSDISNLQISYDGKLVDKLTSTQITFYNMGIKAIRKSDIPQKNHLVL